MITEDRLPNFRPILTDGRPIRRDDSNYPTERILRDDLLHILKAVAILRNAASSPFIDENSYIELLFAMELYCKYADEPDLDWKLLDLVKCMQALGNMNNIIKNEQNRCQSAGIIIHALGLVEIGEKNLMERAYRLRSNRAAHSPTGVSIDRSVLIDLQRVCKKPLKNPSSELIRLFPKYRLKEHV
jgi:hypothetical protein